LADVFFAGHMYQTRVHQIISFVTSNDVSAEEILFLCHFLAANNAAPAGITATESMADSLPNNRSKKSEVIGPQPSPFNPCVL
jgi:hypothetical protein